VSQIESLSQIEEKLNNLSLKAKNNIDNSNTHEELDQLRVSLLGKKGDLSIILKTMGQLSATDRPIVGQKANLIKINLQELITERKNKLNSEALDKKIKKEKIDITIPSIGTPPGNKHPLISTQDEIIDIFCGLGYSVESGPEIETDFYNFESLNIPKNHPARDMQDTFYLDEKLFNSELINFHPLINTTTISIKTSEFINFLLENNKKIHIFSLDSYTIVKSL